MAAALPGVLDGWAPPWWPAGALELLAAVVAPELGDGQGRWFVTSVAGPELDDGRRPSLSR